MRSLLAQLTLLYSEKLTNKEIVNFQKRDIFFYFSYTFIINCVTGTRKMPIEYMFCFICSEQCIKIILTRKRCVLFSSQKVIGVT